MKIELSQNIKSKSNARVYILCELTVAGGWVLILCAINYKKAAHICIGIKRKRKNIITEEIP